MSQITTWRKQLRPVGFLRHTMAELCRKIMNPSASYTYSQYGEDRLLASMVGKETGVYVDVGCHHPCRLSNTYSLYLRGWSGIAIDANHEFAELFKRDRPKDRFVRACVSETESEVTFRVYQDRALSSLYEVDDNRLNAEQKRLERMETLKTRRLDDILQSEGHPKHFDLLSIDVENHDLPVLRSLDLNVYRPRVISIETHDFDANSSASHPVVSHLSRHNYRLNAFQGPNLFFLDRS